MLTLERNLKEYTEKSVVHMAPALLGDFRSAGDRDGRVRKHWFRCWMGSFIRRHESWLYPVQLGRRMSQALFLKGLIILGVAYGFFLTSWHQNLITYLYREHRTRCEEVERSLFERHGFPRWLGWLGWSWPSLRFFLLKQYEILQDLEFCRRARRFRLAVGIYFVTWIIVAAI